jgi:hypothetical protein
LLDDVTIWKDLDHEALIEGQGQLGSLGHIAAIHGDAGILGLGVVFLEWQIVKFRL